MQLDSEEALREALLELSVRRDRERAALREQTAVLNGLERLTKASTPAAGIDALLATVRETLDAEVVFLAQEGPDSPVIVGSTDASVLNERLSNDKLLGPKVRIIVDLGSAVQFKAGLPSQLSFANSLLVAPINVENQARAALVCISGATGKFSAAERDILIRLSTIASQALSTLALAEEKDLLVEVVTGSSSSIAIADATMAGDPLIYVNPAFEELTGYKSHEVIGRNCRFLTDEPEDSLERERLRKAVNNRTTGTFVLRNQKKTGEKFWNRLALYSVRDANGFPTHLVATQNDCTSELTHRDERDQARAQLEIALSSIGEGFLLIDSEKSIVFANSKYAQLFGDADAEIDIDVGRNYADWLQSVLRGRGMMPAEIDKLVDSNLAHLESAPMTWEESLPDGRFLLKNVRNTREGGTVCIATDITSIKRTEQLLEERATAINLTHDAIAITDLDGRFTYMNPSHLHLFGYSSESEVLGKPWSILYSPEDLTRIESEGVPILMKEGSWRAEIDGRKKDGSPVKQEVSLTFVDGLGIICVTRDIAVRLAERREREGLREQLYRAQRQEAVGQLAAGIAHDFNNILAAINGSANLILVGEGLGDKARRDADRILRAGQKGEAMISRLLDLGKSRSSIAVTDVSKTLREVADMVGDVLPGGIQLDLDLPDEAVRLRTDNTALVQIALNLTLNARDAIESQHGCINLSLSRTCPSHIGDVLIGGFHSSSDGIYLVVSDDGVGMNSDSVARILDPYYSTKGEEGTGLGLTVVSGLVQELAGALAVRSAPGEGTSFTVYIPVSDENAPSSENRTAPENSVHHSLRGKAVLIVDDDRDVVDVMARILELQGAEVAAVEHPADALEAVQEDPDAWSLLVTDLTMPHMTGDELADAVHEVSPDLPIILCSGFQHARRRDQNARYTAILSKPVSSETLVETASRALLGSNRPGDENKPVSH